MTAAVKKQGILDTYQGEKKGYFRHGYGCYNYNSFYKYMGSWCDGHKHGSGVLLLKDGTQIQGEFNEGEITGEGLKVWPDGKQVFKGSFLKGHMHGHGQMHYSDGSKYEGQFLNNKRHGYGTLTDENGIYNGQFFENKRGGKGTQVFDQSLTSPAASYTGQWRENMFHGKGKFTIDSFTIIATFERGKPEQIPTRYKIEVDHGTEFKVAKGHPFHLAVSLADQNGLPVQGFSGFQCSVSCWFNIEKLEKFLATKAPQSMSDMASKLSGMPTRETPYLSVVYPLVTFEKLVLSTTLDKWNKKQLPEDEVSARAIEILENGTPEKDVNFFKDFPNMIHSYKVPVSGVVELPDVCLPGDTKDTYPPLVLDRMKREFEEAQKNSENKKTRVVYFGEKPANVKFDALGQPILIASETDTSKSSRNAKHPIQRLLRKSYAQCGEYVLVACDETPQVFYDWFKIPPIKQSFVRLKVHTTSKDD